ncbi:hypothetical protein [Georgenia alba]|uniref:Recombinase A n=1 Tax=Georgenia alba TaxID=2233858 RepID=A0ABW2QBQ1_9MICO
MRREGGVLTAVPHDVASRPGREASPDARLTAARAALARAETAAGLRTRLAGPGLSTSPTLTPPEGEDGGRQVTGAEPDPLTPGADDRALPVPPALAPLFPFGAMARGSVIQVSGSTSVLLAVAAAAATDGGWSALAAMPHIGWRAAHAAGLALDRVAVVPAPGPDASTVVGALADGFDVLVIGRCPALGERDRRSLVSRVRARGAVLLSSHEWPGAHLALRTTRGGWDGLGQGWGHLAQQRLTVRSTGRGGASGTREVRVRVGTGGLLPEPGAAPVAAPGPEPAPRLLRAV